MTESGGQIPETLDYLVFLKMRLGQTDDERREWASLFTEAQIAPELVHRRAARLEKRRLEHKTVQIEFEEVRAAAEQSRRELTDITEENNRLISQLQQDEETIRTLAKYQNTIGPDLTFYLNESRFHR
ncbi:MAG: hypothetical protein EZS28_014506 [Streblomastix strix]|uniref:Uncharacterized protein n=1 Tax=Streblomastix strix TaxID=222440 RepID=A0A5J4W525_9EUKA|nr:MAG: hypothetical protein EZS28_014506 [Streblomastix strix]